MLVTVILVFLHIFFLLGSFIFFRAKLRKVLQLEETESKLVGFINSFNTNAEINLRLLEEKEASLRLLLRYVEKVQKNIEQVIEKKMATNETGGKIIPTKNIPKEIINNANVSTEKISTLGKPQFAQAFSQQEENKENLITRANVVVKSKLIKPKKSAKHKKTKDVVRQEVNKNKKISSEISAKINSHAAKQGVTGNAIKGSGATNISKNMSAVKTKIGEENKKTSYKSSKAYDMFSAGDSLEHISKTLSLDIAEVQLIINLQEAQQKILQQRRKNLVASRFVH